MYEPDAKAGSPGEGASWLRRILGWSAVCLIQAGRILDSNLGERLLAAELDQATAHLGVVGEMARLSASSCTRLSLTTEFQHGSATTPLMPTGSYSSVLP